MTPIRRDLLLVPLDDRPCCRQFPVRLAGLAGARLILPPRHLLGRYLEPGQPDALLAWLEGQAAAQGGAILSLDMLCWGGLVASRRPEQPLEPGLARLARVARTTPSLPAWVFSAIMRTAPTQTSVEEVAMAARLTELSVWMAREKLGQAGAGERVRALRQGLPEASVRQYLEARQRNHGLNLAAVEHAAAGDWRFLLLGIDDSRTEGLNVLEAKALEAAIGRLKAPAAVAPGTDEMAMLMLVRALAPGVAVTVRWSSQADPTRVTRYEDRPLEGVVEAQARAAGVELREASPRQVWVYGPHGEQTEAAVQGRSRRSRRAARFVEDLVREVDRGARVAVADVARSNGADRALVRELLDSGVAARLAGYAAWNTSGNTLGTALATAALVPDRATAASERERLAFLLERLADDWLYQTELRPAVSAPLGGSFIKLDEERLEKARRWVRELMSDRVRRLYRRVFQSRTASRIRLDRVAVELPWPRTFEVGVEVTLRSAD